MKTHNRVRTMSYRYRSRVDRGGVPSLFQYVLRDPHFGTEFKHDYGNLPGDSESHKSLPVPEIKKLYYE